MAAVTQVFGPGQLAAAAALLRTGHCVAFPTETVYGLGADALDEQAVAGIYAAKGRPPDNPLIVHCHSIDQVRTVAKPWKKEVQMFMDEFWPGPLTLVLPKQAPVPLITTGGLDTVAVRIPDHPLALELLREAGVPVAAPSANVSGRPSPTTAGHVLADLDGRIAAVVDGGPTGWGVESTVLDCTAKPFRLLRPGGITLEQLQRIAPVQTDPGVFAPGEGRPRSPGMKYRHYAPDCRVVLVRGDNAAAVINRLAQDAVKVGEQAGVMGFAEHAGKYPGLVFLDMGSKYALQEAAARLYQLLREADTLGLNVLFVEGLPDKELGLAIMNRLRRAAGDVVLDV